SLTMIVMRPPASPPPDVSFSGASPALSDPPDEQAVRPTMRPPTAIMAPTVFLRNIRCVLSQWSGNGHRCRICRSGLRRARTGGGTGHGGSLDVLVALRLASG